MAKFSFLPRNNQFFQLFEESASNMVKTARVLKEIIDNWEDIEAKVKEIDELEHVGDNITHNIIAQLHRTFVTPFDREDIALLAHSLDDVTDFIHAAAGAIGMYRIKSPRKGARELAEIIVQGAVEVETALPRLRQHSNLKQILEHCVEINRLENKADGIFRTAMADLFDEATDMADVIKWREVYEHMESATDRCEDVANVLEGMALKHA